MDRVFLDTSYLAATIVRDDENHEVALEIGADVLARSRPVTSELVFVELLNDFSEWGPEFREAAVEAVDRACAECRVDPQTSRQFKGALELYRKRLDKGWSLVDCASIVTMERLRIRDVVTTDDHFEQAGSTPCSSDARSDPGVPIAAPARRARALRRDR